MEKDPMIKFRSTIRGKNSKGGDRTQLYLDMENATVLTALLTEQLANNEKGVKIDLHTSRKTAQGTNREFDSSICFVKQVQDAPAGMGAPKRFVDTTTPEATKAKIAALSKGVVKG